MPATLLDARTARFLPWLIAIAFFMQSLDATILNTALPSMAQDLGEDPLRMQGVIIAYMLTVALVIPASGWITDRFGSRRIFFGAIALFTFGSLLCALSPSLPVLVGARVIQGLGGALMLPVGRLVILRAYPRAELVRILSFVTMPGLVGPLTGPTLGGWLVEVASWHWIFLINLPVGIAGCLVARKVMPDLRSPLPTPFDGVGFLLFGAAMVLISIALEGLGELHMPHARVVLLLLGGFACMVAYWLRALRIERPLFTPQLFRIRSFAVGIFGNLFARLGSGALPFLTPLLLQVGMGFSPSKAGMTMIPLALSAMMVKPIAKPILDRLGYRRLLIGNTLLLGCLIASLSLIDQNTPYTWLLIHLGLLGAVNSMQFTAMNTLTLIDLHDENASSGNSLMSVVMQLSMGFGVACAAALLGGFKNDYGDTNVLSAFHATYLSVGLLSMLAAAIFFQLQAEPNRKAPAHRVEDPEKSPQGPET
ncbi:EmrB/QacA subfamily drug resistance transporter [Pseudomonas duriflava]|uniref:EmrB/QacA subfamily drug resistance transporter n=1 Tax=Pseudomonas duriflava TaxID=459528 RepID=A0A562QIV8_9PSED|nr:multidrug transporter subunit MdtD [Pseudomonas duriflava]TWI56674.1 EmrB/QacA subfamily drug resistance transporter [Pseudomonas duriflava]